MGILEKGREKRTEEIFEILMRENFSKLMTDTKSQMQEAEGTQGKKNAKSKPNRQRNKETKTKTCI